MTDNDKAAVEAIVRACIRGANRRRPGWEPLAQDLLDAISKAEVPGVWCGALADEIASAQLAKELRAEVERLRCTCDDNIDSPCPRHRRENELQDLWLSEKARADKAEAEVADLKRELQKDWEANCCDLMADAQREKARAEKAAVERDRLAGLLRLARNGLSKVLDGAAYEAGWLVQAKHFIGEIDAALAEVGK